MHDEGRVSDVGVLGDSHGIEAEGSTAAGDGGVFEGETDIEGDGGVHAEGFVDDCSDVFQVLELGIRRLLGRPNDPEDLLAHLGDDIRTLGDFVEEPGESGGGGVAAGEEHGDDLVAEFFAVARVFGEGVKEVVALLVLGFEGGGVECECAVDVGHDEVVENLKVGVDSATGHEVAEFADSVRKVLIKDSGEGEVTQLASCRCGTFGYRQRLSQSRHFHHQDVPPPLPARNPCSYPA